MNTKKYETVFQEVLEALETINELKELIKEARKFEDAKNAFVKISKEEKKIRKKIDKILELELIKENPDEEPKV